MSYRPLLVTAAAISLVTPLRADLEADNSRFIEGLTVAPGLEVSLFADQTQVANPVALALDNENRVYLAETMRFRIGGVDDLRDQPYFFDDDMQIRGLADRLAMYEKWTSKRPMDYYTTFSERVKVLADTDGDGRADLAKIFAEGFDGALDGTIAGLLVDGGEVYVTCIPSVVKLSDTDGDLDADARETLSTGYGVRISLSGHDLHGIIFGPDGKLYFSLGDRGFDVESEEGERFAGPYDGGLFRCNPDGSDLELVYHRLRNPQEIAFDDYGNLFTVDNNGDMGDQARVTYLIEGGDTGWHAGWQVHQTFTRQAGISEKKLNPWMEEHMWEPAGANLPAYLTPAVANLTSGPAGLTVDPGEGSGMPGAYRGHFFVCDYTAGANSGVHHFKLEPDGAGFAMVENGKFVWGIPATDCDFGYDGKLYISDYVEGWHKEFREKGRVFTAGFPGEVAGQPVAALRALAAQDFGSFDAVQLGGLLSHPDRRIRQRAQFVLAKQGDSATLAAQLADAEKPVAHRLHGLWGLGQLFDPSDDSVRDPIMEAMASDEPHLRAQAAKIVGDHSYRPAAARLVGLLADSSAHVRALAAISLGKVGDGAAAGAVLGLIEETGDGDPWLRHAAVMGLLGTADTDQIAMLVEHENRHVRMAGLLALRRLEDPRIAGFLDDADTAIYEEAARAIYALPVGAALPRLAAQISPLRDGISPLTVHRILRANFRLGGVAEAAAVATFAADDSHREADRAEALEILVNWGEPHPVDRIEAKWWPIEPRAIAGGNAAIRDAVLAIIGSESDGKLKAAAAQVAKLYGANLSDETLLANLLDPAAEVTFRIEALGQLAESAPDKLRSALPELIAAGEPEVQIAAFRTFAELDPASAFPALAAASGALPVRQAALRLLGGLASVPEASRLVGEKLDALGRGEFPAELQLDLILAAEACSNDEVAAKLAAYRAKLAARPLGEQYPWALEGGRAAAGETVFRTHAAGQCMRCHKVDDQGGIAGPDLSATALLHDRPYLLESVVDPGATITPGYGIVSATLTDGTTVTGALMEQTETRISIKLPDGAVNEIAAADVASVTPAVSPMPPMGYLLQPDELRDVVAYLATLKREDEGRGDH